MDYRKWKQHKSLDKQPIVEMAEEDAANPASVDYEDINVDTDSGAINQVFYHSDATDSSLSKHSNQRDGLSPTYPRQSIVEGTVFSTDI